MRPSKLPEPPEGWEARKPTGDGELTIESDYIGGIEREIILKIESIVYPIIEGECKHLGITYPRIKWVTSFKVRGKEHKGGYNHGARERIIYQNAYTIKKMLEEGETNLKIITRVIRSCLHELSHYVDDEYHKIGFGAVVKDYKYYEVRADEYAESLMPPKLEVRK